MKEADETIYEGNVEDINNTTQSEEESVNVEGKNKKSSGHWKHVMVGGISGMMFGMAGSFVTNQTVGAEEMGEEAQSSSDSVQPTPVSPDTHVTVSGLPIATVGDDLSFGEAFAAAREQVGVGGVFEWHGGVYGTFYAEEWDAMTPEERVDFNNRVDYSGGLAEQPTVGHEMGNTGNIASAEESHAQNASPIQDTSHVINAEESVNTEVEVLGVYDATLADGSSVTIGQAVVGGHEVYMVDVNQDDVADIMGMDLNGDGSISGDEFRDVSDVGISMTDLASQANMNDPNQNYLAEGPDYVNDADPGSLA